jgi:hypothetical protein
MPDPASDLARRKIRGKRRLYSSRLGQRFELLEVAQSAHERCPKLIGKAPGCLNFVIFGTGRVCLTNAMVSAPAAKDGSFHSRPFGLVTAPLWRTKWRKASEKVYPSVNFLGTDARLDLPPR